MKFIAIMMYFSAFIFFIVIILLAFFYYNEFKWKSKYKRTKNIKNVTIPIGPTLNEKSFKDVTESLNKKVKVRLNNNLSNIRTITTTAGSDGVYYITAWYKAKEYDYKEVEKDLRETFRF